MVPGRKHADWIFGWKLSADLVPFALAGHDHGSSGGLDESVSAINLGPERKADELHERLQVAGERDIPGMIVVTSDSESRTDGMKIGVNARFPPQDAVFPRSYDRG